MAPKKGNAGLFILVDDLSRYASSPVEPYLEGKTVTDACGRRWIADPDAAVVLASAEAAWQEECRLRSEHQAYLADRASRRASVARSVREKMGGGGTPESSPRIQQVVWEALREFDATEGPERGFYEWKDSRSSMAGAR
jgi:hypothetical protein